MGNGNDDRDDDLTRLENLTEFLHEEDSEIDSIFENLSSQQSQEKSTTQIHDDNEDESVIMDLDQIEDADSEFPPAFPEEFQDEDQEEAQEEIHNQQHSEDLYAQDTQDFFETEQSLEEDQEEDQEDGLFTNDSSFSFELDQGDQEGDQIAEEDEEETTEAPFSQDSYDDSYNSPAPVAETLTIPEKLTDLKQFASEFSYGKSNIAPGNPPFSVILRNVKYQDDVEDIKRLLNEFGIMNESNQEDYERSLEMGALLISQISEFSAIVLAHKFRRFDLDLEVGLSDEINPPRSGDTNAKGLIKKETINQNTRHKINLQNSEFSIADVIMSTSQNIPEYKVLEYLGVHSSMSLVDEDDLMKLQYVDKTLRNQDEIFNLSIDEDILNETSKSLSKDAFLSYQKSFNLIFDELKIRLKQKAYSQGANAMLGISFGVSPLNFQAKSSSQFSITCSATFAKIIKE